MIAKIGHGANIVGALSYNLQKVHQENGQVLFTQKMRESRDGTFNLGDCYRSFEPYLAANRNTEKPSLHISLNPDPADNVDDDRYIKMAQEYMNEMGYGQQPYIVFKHTDIERTHIHIVSTNVDRIGKKIPDTFEHRRSMQACRQLEKKYGLTVPATERQHDTGAALFKPVDFKQGNSKSQIASVVRYLPKYYSYQSFGAYNALLSLFNITAQEVTGEQAGKPRQGMVYFALDASGQKVSNPFKSSLFGIGAGHAALQAHFEKSGELFKEGNPKGILKNTIELAMHTSNNENGFIAQLKEQGINTVVRRNPEGRIYGITFIDHASRSVWNGSQLAKGLSANAFNQWWNEGIKPQSADAVKSIAAMQNTPSKEKAPEGLFGFLDKETSGGNTTKNLFLDSIGSLLPSGQGEDYDELAFANQMKRKRKHKR
ncbi:relaxase [Flavobacterium zepuense]|uniref:Relaxase n=1 Tax=Flavobacterium zepuense TaxID=2593302 RepID=A0A552UZH6_9FLAO|nr:conjugal transfer protein MobB [Flavobacterium zepuense]TRW23643.1 relaxase [Flavobacterium zepuense]